MAGRCRRARWAVLVALTGCAVFDPAQPIELVPGDNLDAYEVARLEAAGECWNLRFGTQFTVTRSPRTEQAVFVQYDNLPCISAAGVFTPGVPARIDVCPPEHYEGPYHDHDELAITYFNTVQHELGHAAGIRDEGEGDYSVMGRNIHAYLAEQASFRGEAFSSEDVALFRDAHPDFAADSCTARMRSDAASGVRCYCP